MTLPAREATPDEYYRLTRDPGQSYYVICTPAQTRALTKRVVGKDVRLLSADDRRLLQSITKCRDEEHVLGIRFTRYLTDSGERREMRAYVAFPPDYQLRAVAKPPGYGPSKRAERTPSQGAETDGSNEESEEEVDSGEAGGAGSESTG
jgi:hypothetical protein